MKIVKKLIYPTKIFAISVIFLLFLTILPYFNAEMYDFHPKSTFKGSTWFNPYFTKDSLLLKANFHSHTFAWGKLTNGHHTPSEVHTQFKKLGYDIPTISNYHQIDTTGKHDSSIIYIPTYEHGYNVKKRHHQPLGATSIVWLDFVFLQTIHHKQYMLNCIAPTCSVLTVNHPSFSNGFDAQDFTLLKNYDLMEVLNHYRTSFPHWDSALSAGISAMIVSNDDMKHLDAKGQCGAFWTMIYAQERTPSSVYSSLKRGNSYGVRGIDATNGDKLESVSLIKDSLSIRTKITVDSIRFIHQNGVAKEVFTFTNQASILLLPHDTYVRTEIYVDSLTTYFLNPVFRYDKNPFTSKRDLPTVNTFSTLLYRSVIAIIELTLLGVIFLLIQSMRKKKVEKVLAE